MTFMPRRQRNPSRRCFEVAAFDDAFCSFIAPQTRIMRPPHVVDQEPLKPMNRLGLFRALQSEGRDTCLIKVPANDGSMSDSSPINPIKADSSPDARHRRHITPHSPRPRSSKLFSRSTTPGRWAETEAIGDGPSIQGICMWGEKGWEAVVAKTDPDADESILDTSTASALRLPLQPIPRHLAKKITLSNSKNSHPEYCAEKVVLKSVDIPPLLVNIIVAPVRCKIASLVIGRELSSLLENSANKATANSPSLDWNSMSGEDQLHSVVEKLQPEGGRPLNSASSLASPEIFPFSTFPGHIASLCRGNESCYPWLGDISANAELLGIVSPGAWEMQTGCGGSFEGI
ncbi:hypothetical protein B0J13DRAFT_178831 [Dactylonectria estremocensis]|uniref:Uncharacterized protein n=1 Tax=Dactylonectria estremocensis TaxID=1079267 RepID=A0A9P9JEZ1_9HYPO|nr:hypothetical protein B0J13DRAFT_178831 [Dactylonectria estremocensis]